MNFKKAGIIGTLCAMGALAPQKTNADTIYVVEEPVYTTTYTTTPVVSQQVITQPVYTTPRPQQIYTTPVVQQVYTTPVIYNNGYYNGYYDAMNRRWWYNNAWSYTCPPIYSTPRVYGGYCGGYRTPMPRYNYCTPSYRPHYSGCAPMPRYNHCAPARVNHCAPARVNHCAPVRVNHCAPRGGFHHGGGPRGGRHCR